MKPIRSCNIHIDGSSLGNPGPSGVGIVFSETVDGQQTDATRKFSRYVGVTTNNVAEYLALLYALQEALLQGCRVVSVKSDSELLTRQLKGLYRVKNGQLHLLHGLANHLIAGFERFVIEHVPREQNRQADRLANDAARSGGLPL
ncbi:MAG: ribonuclease HI family protein [Candidatus Omnitrophica bacterium]|nr:ribonuclease HI family protein [Candidatus Omnitrophota bacterium]MBI3010168.1 ribonuclease HI family protein [Candidatus Omnitrophota bacterium]